MDHSQVIQSIVEEIKDCSGVLETLEALHQKQKIFGLEYIVKFSIKMIF